MLNWDWVNNRPASPPSPDQFFDPGYWHHAKELLKPPLLDPTVPEDRLAAWLDKHTMAVHNRLLERRHKIRQAEKPGTFMLDPNDEYAKRLSTLTP